MQRSYLDRLRAILGGMLGSMVVLAALLVWLPAPTFTWWMGHFIAVELGRPLAACGLAAALAVSSWRVRGGILVAAVLVAIPGERTRLYTGSHAAAASIPVLGGRLDDLARDKKGTSTTQRSPPPFF